MRHLPPVHFPLPPKALLASLTAGWRDRQGQEAHAVAALQRRFPSRSVTLLDSGTSALSLAITASDTARPGRAPLVALPAYACPDLGTAAVAADARVALYDVDPGTLQPDLSSLAEALALGATHVVVIHLYGRATDVGAVRALAAVSGAIVIEDAAQGADACFAGVATGNLADWSVLSLGRGKGYNAGGGGILLGPEGAAAGVLSRRLEAPRWTRELRHASIALLTQLLSHPLVYALPAGMPTLGVGETRYHAPSPAAAMTLSALALLDDAFEGSARAANARRRREQQYLDALRSAPHLELPLPHPASVSGALRVPVLMDPRRAAPLYRLGVVRSYPRTLDAYGEIAARLESTRRLPGALELAARMHTLPTHRLLREREADSIVRTLAAEGA